MCEVLPNFNKHSVRKCNLKIMCQFRFQAKSLINQQKHKNYSLFNALLTITANCSGRLP